MLELEELIYAGRDERVAYSRDLFAPGGIDVMVLRSLESTRPARVAAARAARGVRGRRAATRRRGRSRRRPAAADGPS